LFIAFVCFAPIGTQAQKDVKAVMSACDAKCKIEEDACVKEDRCYDDYKMNGDTPASRRLLVECGLNSVSTCYQRRVECLVKCVGDDE
jgi:hypothetical protein